MKKTMLGKTLLSVLVFATLSSCSLAYSVEIVVRDGVVVFIPYELGLFGGRKRDVARVESIRIEAVGRTPSLVWEIASSDYNGTELPQVAYGSLPKEFTEKVKSEALRIGQLYQVQIQALGGGGDRYFVISRYEHYREPDVTVLTASPPN